MLLFLGKGIFVGITIAAPVGPIGILCIHRSLHQGYKWGFITGMGAATADVIFGSIAGFGLTFISNELLHLQHWIHLLGGFYLLSIGGKILLSKPPPATTHPRLQTNKNIWPTYLGSLFLNLTSPITILLFLSIFSEMGLLNSAVDYAQTSLLVLGILLGSSLWWLTLCGSVSFLLRHRVKQTALTWINRISGAVILLFAGFILF